MHETKSDKGTPNATEIQQPFKCSSIISEKCAKIIVHYISSRHTKKDEWGAVQVDEAYSNYESIDVGRRGQFKKIILNYQRKTIG